MGRRPKLKIEQRSRVEHALETVPDPPPTLSGYGRDYWLRIAPLLVAKGALSAMHLEPLEALCDCWDRYQTLKRWLAEDPERWIDHCTSGRTLPSTAAKQYRESLVELQRLWPRFGVTPHAEPRLAPRSVGGQLGGTRGTADGMTLEDWQRLKTAGDEDGRLDR